MVAISVIVPVHDEGALIAKTAQTLLAGLPQNTQIIFACNGCRDDSASKLRSIVGPRGLILELAYPNKAKAIAEAERHASAFPRFYIDADVAITGEEITKLADALATGDLDLVSPRLVFDQTGSSWSARAVNSIWLSLPHGSTEGFHAVLGVSARGRAAWGELPNIMADDTFISSHIDPAGKAIVSDVSVVVRPPRTLRSFIRVRERWLRGDRQLTGMGITIPKTEGQARSLIRLALRDGRALPVLIYIVARLAAEALAILPMRSRGTWYRDRTSRTTDVRLKEPC